MPYLSAPYPPQAELLASAERRWGALSAGRPDMGDAVRLQRTLLVRVLELSRALDGGRLPRLALPPRYLAAKLARGVPALSGEPIPLPVAWLKAAVLAFCDDLAAGGAGDAARHLADAVGSGRLDAGSLLAASLDRDQEAIRTGASRLALSPDLTWLVAELAVGPVAHALQRTLFAPPPGSPLAAALAAWNEGHCPACGSWPALAEIVARHRLLRCSFCAATWERTIYACVYCDAAGDTLVAAAPDPQQPGRRLELCKACGAYLKTIDADTPSPYPLVALADMETMDLDVAATDHRFGRPPLRSFQRLRR